jgi:hypothetical protein
MASEIRAFVCPIPAGTLQTVPYTQDLSFPARAVERIEAVIPPGPNGVMGFSLGAAGQPVIPFQAGAWIVASGEKIVFDLNNFWDSGSWTFFGYNSGSFAHTVYLRFFLNLPATLAPAGSGSAIDIDTLTGTVPLVTADTVAGVSL